MFRACDSSRRSCSAVISALFVSMESLVPLAAREAKIRPHAHEVDHHGSAAPHDHRPGQNLQAAVDTGNLKDTHDARHSRIHALAGLAPEHRYCMACRFSLRTVVRRRQKVKFMYR